MIDIFLHLDRYLVLAVSTYGSGIYALIFLVIFCETGLVVTPFLPGDSLLFAAGTLAALAALRLSWLLPLLFLAAVLGDTVNYWLGYRLGPAAFQRWSRWLKPAYLERTRQFYERHGAKTIVLARFVPMIRTFAPFVAGVGRMHYPRFLAYNLLGALLWVGLFTLGGFFFGNIPLVKQNFEWVILGIIALSLLPALGRFYAKL